MILLIIAGIATGVFVVFLAVLFWTAFIIPLFGPHPTPVSRASYNSSKEICTKSFDANNKFVSESCNQVGNH